MASDPAAGSAVSPLEEIEARVQARAKDLLLDLGTTGDRAVLRELVEDEIGAWASQYQRGLRDHDLASPELVADRVLRNLAGYGPLQPLLADDDVWEIMVRRYADLALCP
ncbi:MAG: hypothetical protein M3N37_05755 [Actinomycetota bacterium]|nr:hypothetical protein [Actinomycetota bacterium]